MKKLYTLHVRAFSIDLHQLTGSKHVEVGLESKQFINPNKSIIATEINFILIIYFLLNFQINIYSYIVCVRAYTYK